MKPGNPIENQWQVADAATRLDMITFLVERYPDLICAIIKGARKCRREGLEQPTSK